jgi:hypothetical protein
LNIPIVFVGGAPRSGTTLVYSLMCTSRDINDYAGESSYLTALLKVYRVGLIKWEVHTQFLFPSRDAFREHMRSLVSTSLAHLYDHLGRPSVLALKDPLLTPVLPLVDELLSGQARYVVVLRHPFDVVRSRQQVFERECPNERFGPDKARAIAREYADTYEGLDTLYRSGRLYWVKYENLSDPAEMGGLAAFLSVSGFSEAGLTVDDFEVNDPWYSPKYGRPVDLTRRLTDLDQVYKSIVHEVCAPLMQQYGYRA